jgi:ElaB/YqjD/DUF883 family membrane-anchored ribosome-binding protein
MLHRFSGRRNSRSERGIVHSHLEPAEREKAMANVGNDYDNIRDDISALKRQLADLLKHTSAAARAKADDLRDLPEQGAETLREQVRESPLASIAIAFIAGSIVGRMMR